jgi:hypothetical protein
MAGCKTDEDCSLLGVCESTWCLCDSGWTGDDCGEFESAIVLCSELLSSELPHCTNRTQVSVKEPSAGQWATLAWPCHMDIQQLCHLHLNDLSTTVQAPLDMDRGGLWRGSAALLVWSTEARRETQTIAACMVNPHARVHHVIGHAAVVSSTAQ